MTKKILIISFLIAIIAIAGFFSYNYIMYGGGRDLATEATDYTISSKNISAEFSANTDASNKKYLEKAVAISGKITQIKNTEIILDNTIICNLKTTNISVKKDQTVTVKGRVVGYDDLMGELRLDQCFVITNN